MTLKIEVGDKVRIVAEGAYGNGQQGAVMLGPDNVGGYRVRLRPHDNCWYLGWYLIDEMALFADELEDMPEDTVVTLSDDHGRPLTGSVAFLRECFGVVRGTQ